MLSAMNRTATLKSTVSKVLGAAVLALTVISFGAPQASARNVCMKHADMTSLLNKHKEAQTSIGLASNGSLIEVFTSADGGTWSIVMTDARGNSCVVAIGKDWDHRAQMILGQAT